jgi:hypothetical protein
MWSAKRAEISVLSISKVTAPSLTSTTSISLISVGDFLGVYSIDISTLVFFGTRSVSFNPLAVHKQTTHPHSIHPFFDIKY